MRSRRLANESPFEATERVTRVVEIPTLRDALSRGEAADVLGIPPRTLATKLRELGLKER